MWTDFDGPPQTIVAEIARERARSKKRRKQPPRSKRRSNGASHAANSKLRRGKSPSSLASIQPTASVVHEDLVTRDRELSRSEQAEVLQAPILEAGPIICAADVTTKQTHSFSIERREITESNVFDLPISYAIPINHNEIDGRPDDTLTPSAIAVTLQQTSKSGYRHCARRRVSAVVAGSAIFCSTLWFINPISYPTIESVTTTDQASVSIRVWMDPPPPERVRSVAETSPIASQPMQEVVVAPTGLAIVQKAPSEVLSHVDLPKDDRLVEATSVAVVPVPQEIVQSVSAALVPIPPRRPASLIARYVPVTHPVPTAAAASIVASTERAVEQAGAPELYASFSARKHEIGTHKLPWGMARLHEDPNSDSGRGAVWDFVPAEP